ncbi:Mitochondrial ribonuclease P protein 1 like protein [Melipona quadrifasciata]|uniref:RNA (guanine-9-)-methyltransferase domain-containing protein 1 n=1 Tax=Melipona quadrifasciata TaxID=166423 RepID=A0A0N0U4R9_9HYME|nr:Mitochondrial ribonuclease P protein 1 like protein [Melipona quadrifasciata]
MCTKFSLNFITVATKFHSNAFFIQPVHKFTVSLPKYFVETNVITRGYSLSTTSVSKHYEKLDEEKLNNIQKNPKYKALYDTLSLEIEYIKYLTGNVPSKLTVSNWLYLLKTETKGERRSYIDFLFKLEKKQENKKQKLLKERAKRSESKINDENKTYGLGKCTLFHRIVEKTMNDFYNNKLISAMLYEPTLIFDLGFEEHMSQAELSNCSKQLLFSFSINRQHIDPFNLYFCNASKNSDVMKKLHKTIPNIYNPEFPLNITSKSYSEIFDKKKLVYLTPHTNEIMTHYNPELVYIIGAIVDKFPLKEILNWGTGSSKNLPLNHVVSIMLDLKHTKNWDIAFKNIPKRKLQQSREEVMKKKLMQKVRSLQNAKNSELMNKEKKRDLNLIINSK